ncbi:lysozyme inhibitor LprI family protein [Phyllobacterium sp. TAF24]|uniref:lysozyme inhibitor LprI family protein n=1 Tax=Phyllobacterium sp. TAF24 TaxID=3233068 RepID=UPI003F99A5F7
MQIAGCVSNGEQISVSLRSYFLITFSALGLVFIAAAVPANADDIYDNCIAKYSDNPSWGQCGGEWVKREDDKLNKAWNALFATAHGNTKTDLLAEQRLWNTYKDGACKFYDNGEWGREGQVLSFPICRAEIIAARTKNLESYSSGLQGER